MTRRISPLAAVTLAALTLVPVAHAQLRGATYRHGAATPSSPEFWELERDRMLEKEAVAAADEAECKEKYRTPSVIRDCEREAAQVRTYWRNRAAAAEGEAARLKAKLAESRP